MTYIPDWTEDNITRQYLDRREPDPEIKSCEFCSQKFYDYENAIIRMDDFNFCFDCFAKTLTEKYFNCLG